MSELLLLGLFGLLVLLAIIAVRASDLLLAAMALGTYGFVLALIWAAIGAVDVAFTEAVVGAGATTVFFLAALLRTSRRRSALPGHVQWGVLAATLAVGAVILTVTSALPRWGDPASPASVHVSPRYLERTIDETATPNAVTAVLADYRAYDTLIEAVVIFTAGVGGWLLLRRRGQ